jgi:hypothetical protein
MYEYVLCFNQKEGHKKLEVPICNFRAAGFEARTLLQENENSLQLVAL